MFLVDIQAAGGTLVSISLKICSTNWFAVVSTSTFLRIDEFAFSPMYGFTSSETIKVAWIQIGSSIGSTNSLLLVSTFTFSEDFTIVDFIISADTIILLSDFSTFHQTFVSVSLVIDTTNWDVSLMAFTIPLDGWASSFTEEIYFSALQIAHVIISDSINTANSIEKTFTMFTSLWFRIGAFTIV